ncbi:ABC transporter permease subunit [Chitinimonas sp. BJB300]
MWLHLVTTWRSGIRSRALQSIAILAVLLMFAALLASKFSGRHPQTVALDVGLSGLRLVLALLAVFWVHELVSRENDRKTVFFTLAYPCGRGAYWFGRYAGIVSLLLVACLSMGGAVFGLVALSGVEYQQFYSVHFGADFLGVLAACVLDSAVITAFTMLIASFATTSLMPMASGLAFAFVARSYGAVIALLQDQQSGAADLQEIQLPIVKTIGYLIPDLSLLDLRDLVLYGDNAAILLSGYGVAQSIAYGLVCLILSAWIFDRREFQ